jgi:hypothetical protein
VLRVARCALGAEYRALVAQLVWGFYARSADAVFALRGSEGSVQSLLVYAGSARGIYVPVLARYKKLVFASVLHHASSHSARRRAHVLDHLA